MRQVERTTRKTTTEAIHRTDDGNAQNSESSEGRDRRSPAASASPPHQLRHWTEQLETLAGRVRQVVKQTRARIFGGITHSPSKIVSLFEPHTEERPTHHLSEAGTRSSRENGLSKRRPGKAGTWKIPLGFPLSHYYTHGVTPFVSKIGSVPIVTELPLTEDVPPSKLRYCVYWLGTENVLVPAVSHTANP